MFKIFKNMTKKEWGLVFCSAVFIVIQVWLDLKIPDYMSEITMLVQTEGSEMNDILAAGGKMLLCALGGLLSSVIVAVLASRISSNFSSILREKIFSKVQSFSMKEIGGFSTASLITRSTNDITQIQMFVDMGLQALIKAPITAVWAIIKISGKSWQWTTATAVSIVILLFFVGLCVMLALPKFKIMQKLTDNLNRITRENLTGLSVIRAYNAEHYQADKFEKANDELTNTNLFANRVMSVLMPGIQIAQNGLSLAVYWIGAVLINNAAAADKMTYFSDMVVFSSYAIQVIMSLMMLVMVFIMLPRVSVSAKRITEVLDTKCSIADENGIKADNDKSEEIEFKNVSFSYNGTENCVLHNISFTAHKGETVAIIGSTGCGKSTLINLVPRFYDATKGEVLVDGINVKSYSQYDLRNKIGYVSQKAILFSGTVKSNVAYGDNGKKQVSDYDIKKAVDTAQASEFVEKTEKGYENYVSQGGSNLSGGQKQRLSIARAICRHPEILIFDDSFSALDYKTDRALRLALKKECKDTTKLIVAQRIGTILDADCIIVLDEGKIVGKDNHNQLMENCEVYKQIAYSQLSKEELA